MTLSDLSEQILSEVSIQRALNKYQVKLFVYHFICKRLRLSGMQCSLIFEFVNEIMPGVVYILVLTFKSVGIAMV